MHTLVAHHLYSPTTTKKDEQKDEKMKPPFIRLYIKDFAFDIQDMSNEQLGEYMRIFLNSYRSDNIPDEKLSDSLFKELKSSSEQYFSVCERNKNNRLKSKLNKNDSSTSGQPVVNDSLTNNHEPITNNHEPIKIYNIGKFKKPTVEEITQYCKERKNQVQADRFFDYYEANGWKVGKNSMKDWKAAIRTWEKTSQSNKKGTLNNYSSQYGDAPL